MICFLVFLSNAPLFSQVTRIAGMGNLFLITEDEDNNLNIYDKGKNSAFLINDESKDWLKMSISSTAANGNLHRLYDPAGLNFYDLHFEALKIIDENQTFKGIIEYSDHKRKDVYRSIQTQTYGSQPFMLMDTTTGSLDFYGPKLAFEYSIFVTKNLSLGADFNYAGEKGLKSVYTKPEITNRYISGQISLAYSVSDNFVIGTKFDPFYNYEKIEMAKDPNLGTDPISLKYRGFYKYRVYSDDFTRYNKNKGFDIDIESHFKNPDSTLQLFISAGYAKQGINCEDGTKESEYEGYWQEDGFNGSLFARYNPDFIDENLTFGFGLTYKNMNSWSKHPQLPIIFTESDWKKTEISAGIEYNFQKAGLIIGAEFHKILSDTTSDDYLGNYHFDASNPATDIRIGAEYRLQNNLWIRLGYNHFIYDPDAIIKDTKYNKNLYTFGVSYQHENFVKIDLLINYGKKDSKETITSLTYKETSAVLFAKFFVF